MGDKPKEYKLTSGAVLLVSESTYENVIALHDAVVQEMRGGGLGSMDVAAVQRAFEAAFAARKAAEGDEPVSAEDQAATDRGFNLLVDKVLGLLGSRAVKNALFACAGSAMYLPGGAEDLKNAVQLDPAAKGYGVFDHPSDAVKARARADFYDVCRALAEENLRPFGKALFSMFMGLVGSSAASRASTSTKP